MRKLLLSAVKGAWLLFYIALLAAVLPLGMVISLVSQPFDGVAKDRWRA